MPIANQQIGSTQPKSGTYQFSEHRLQGITLKLPSGASYTSISNNRIVSLQEDTNGVRYAVPAPVAQAGLTIIGYGVLEEALQSSGNSSIAPSPNTFQDGDPVVVLRGIAETYMIDYDPSNKPTLGIATAYMDQAGRLSSVGSGSNLALKGSVFASVPGRQMANQLKTSCLFYEMESPVVP